MQTAPYTSQLCNEILKKFRSEFGVIADRFNISAITLSESNKPSDLTDRPGVYIHHCDEKVVRVGRSLKNARKRALEHIRDNTGGSMSELATNPGANLILLTVSPKTNTHWIAALEIYLEESLAPAFPSKRKC